MNGEVFHKIAETEKYIFYDKKIFSKSQWRILKWQTGYNNVTQMKLYPYKSPFIQLTPRYKMEYPINLKRVEEFTEKHNLKFWV